MRRVRAAGVATKCVGTANFVNFHLVLASVSTFSLCNKLKEKMFFPSMVTLRQFVFKQIFPKMSLY